MLHLPDFAYYAIFAIAGVLILYYNYREARSLSGLLDLYDCPEVKKYQERVLVKITISLGAVVFIGTIFYRLFDNQSKYYDYIVVALILTAIQVMTIKMIREGIEAVSADDDTHEKEEA